MNQPLLSPFAVDYPCSDGAPMAESEFQLIPLLYVLTALRSYFEAREDVYVVGDMFLYYEEGNPGAVVVPDVFVVVGAAKHKRHSYKLWEEPKGPDFVLEVTARSTRREDQGLKREVYASLGVREYWLYDPTGDYLAPALEGLGLGSNGYESLPSVEMSGGMLSLRSEVLRLDLRLVDGELRLHDPANGEDLITHREMEARLQRKTAARQAAEAHIAELEARLGPTVQTPPRHEHRPPR